MELLKLLSASELAAQIISFLLLFFLLRVLMWKRILGVLDERKNRIAAELHNIDDVKSTVEKLKADYEAKVGSAEATGKVKIQEAALEGQRVAEEIKKEAQGQAEKIIENARADTRYELARAKEELKDEIVDLVLKTTEHVIQEKLTPQEDRKVVENFLDRLEKMP
jgi:F-type H+-transporting ATPase subunit b